MTTKTRKVYYCDFCDKKGLRSDIVAKHEIHCTLNPKRECGMCGAMGIPTPQLDVFMEEFGTSTLKNVLEVYKEVGNCPACMLAVIRTNKLSVFPQDGFDYKAEATRYMEEKRSEETSEYA